MLIGLLAVSYLGSALIGAIVVRLAPLVGICVTVSIVLLATRYPDLRPAFAVLLLAAALTVGRILRIICSDLLDLFGELGPVKFLKLFV